MTNYTTGEEVYQLLLTMDEGPPVHLDVDGIEPIIDGIEAQVDGVLTARGYSVPATGTTDVKMIAYKVRQKAAVDVARVLYKHDTTPGWCKAWDQDFAAWLQALQRAEMHLVDQSPRAKTGVRLVGRYMEDD